MTALQDACARTFAWLSPFTEALGALRHITSSPLFNKRALLFKSSHVALQVGVQLTWTLQLTIAASHWRPQQKACTVGRSHAPQHPVLRSCQTMTSQGGHPVKPHSFASSLSVGKPEMLYATDTHFNLA